MSAQFNECKVNGSVTLLTSSELLPRFPIVYETIYSGVSIIRTNWDRI